MDRVIDRLLRLARVHRGRARTRAAGESPGIWQEFARGFWNPSPWLLVLAAAVTVVALAEVQNAVTSGAATALPESRLLRMPFDDWGNVSYQVALLKRHPPRHLPVYLVGGSNVRKCIADDASLAAAIRSRDGVPVEVHDFGSMNQTLGETMAIVDNLPRSSGGVLLIGVNQARFAYSPDQVAPELEGRELLLSSPALRQFMRIHRGHLAWPPTILPGIFNYVATYFQDNEHWFLDLRLPSIAYKRHKYTLPRLLSRAAKNADVQTWLNTDGRPGGTFDRWFAFNAALLQATVKLARQRGFTVALLEAPENHAIVGHKFDRYKRVYQPFCRELAAQYGASYLNFVGRIGLDNGDFYDVTHMVEPGRAKWQRGLADALGPLLAKAQGAAR